MVFYSAAIYRLYLKNFLGNRINNFTVFIFLCVHWRSKKCGMWGKEEGPRRVIILGLEEQNFLRLQKYFYMKKLRNEKVNKK